jgi:hypothetical protein
MQEPLETLFKSTRRIRRSPRGTFFIHGSRHCHDQIGGTARTDSDAGLQLERGGCGTDMMLQRTRRRAWEVRVAQGRPLPEVPAKHKGYHHHRKPSLPG